MVIVVAQLRSCFAAVRIRCKSPKQFLSPLIQQAVPHSPDHHRLRAVPGVPDHLALPRPLQHEPQTAPHDRARHRQMTISGVVHTPLMPSAHWTKFLGNE